MQYLEYFARQLYLSTTTTGISDSPIAEITAILSDGVEYSDSLLPTVTVVLSDNIEYSDSVVPTITVQPSDGINISESFAVTITATPSDTVDITDSPGVSITAGLSDQVNIDDDVYHIIYNDPLGSGIKSEFEECLADVPEEDMTLVKVSETTDDLGNVASTSETEVAITGKLSGITETEREQLEIGTITKGHMKGYFKETYTVDSNDYEIEVGDAIVRYGVRYRVESIAAVKKLAGHVILIKAILRRII